MAFNSFPNKKKDGKKSVLTGDAAVGDVLSGQTFYNNSPVIKQTGTLALTGTAAAGDVSTGKTFYNTDAKTVVTGTAKRQASGIITPPTGITTVSGLGFTPSVIIVRSDNGSNVANQRVYWNLSNLFNSQNIDYNYSMYSMSGTSPFTVSFGTFTVNAPANVPLTWVAYE
jgi:hypothetical protein